MVPKIPLASLTILENIGSGSFGEVYRGVCSGERTQTLAVKMAQGTLDRSREGAGESGGGERCRLLLLQEAAVAAQLRHPHVLRLLGMGVGATTPVLVSVLVYGQQGKWNACMM